MLYETRYIFKANYFFSDKADLYKVVKVALDLNDNFVESFSSSIKGLRIKKYGC